MGIKNNSGKPSKNEKSKRGLVLPHTSSKTPMPPVKPPKKNKE